MADQLEMVALALLWTEGAHQKPRRRVVPPADDLPPPRLCDAQTLEAALILGGTHDVEARAASLRARAAMALDAGRASGLDVVVRGDPAYPDLLRHIPDPPPALWTHGTFEPGDCTVAIVGSRTATSHGIEMSFRLAEGLARAGVTIVSGLARGVDGAAHRGALRGGGPTIAVLGSGADVIYPPEHLRLSQDIAGAGAVVSEFAPGTPPSGWHFPRRNRIISGLCQGVVVVEATDHSGSLITAKRALEQGRDVMAVPGGVLSGRNRGAHALLRDGARVVETADDVIEQLGLDRRRPREGENEANLKVADPILRAMLAGEAYDLEALCDRTGLDAVRLLAKLAQLELAGWVQRIGGGRFVKAGANVLR